MKKLQLIQKFLKAPKDKYNTFGNYNYRSLEGILEGVKPLLDQYNCTLIIEDQLEQIGDRYYVKATATIKDIETGEARSCSAYAREVDTKKGSDPAQITGMASSYARKYACNGLFCIDDSRDPDDNEVTKKTRETEAEKATEGEIKSFMKYAEKIGADIKEIGKQVGATSLLTMTKEQVGKANKILMEMENEKKQQPEG